MSAPAFMIMWCALLPAIFAVAIVFAPTPWAPLLVVAGVVVWTLTEYFLHRFVFHFEARSAFVKRLVFIIHGNHHADPNDPLRNLMPPAVSLPVGALVWLLSVSVFGVVGTWGFLGFMASYVTYDLLHYGCHQWPMKGRLGRVLKLHHMRHHHLKVEGNYAITGMVWDRLLATRISSNREKA